MKKQPTEIESKDRIRKINIKIMKRRWKNNKTSRSKNRKHNTQNRHKWTNERDKTIYPVIYSAQRVSALSNRRKSMPVVPVPENFSLIQEEYLPESLLFFEKLSELSKIASTIKLKFKNITSITQECLLYLLLLFDYFTAMKHKCQIKGDEPSDINCKKLFIDSGIYRYVKKRTPRNEKKIDEKNSTFSIRDGIKVEPQTADAVLGFIEEHFPDEPKVHLDHIYQIILECMGNTQEHAFEKESTSERFRQEVPTYRKWWILAHADDDKRVIVNCGV